MWTATALKSEARAAHGEIWRVVEHQYTASTRKLVDTQAEQEILEALLEDSKPPYPPGTDKLHYLLKTPFRYYPPKPHGSRFRQPGGAEGVFYASEQIRTALAEMAYYRLRFFADAPDAKLPDQEQKLTVFNIKYKTKRQIDLTCSPLNRDQSLWTDPADYAGTHALAEQARKAAIESIRYGSVRDREQGFNIALLTPIAFVSKKPLSQQTWYMHIGPAEISTRRAGKSNTENAYVFAREWFTE